MLGIHRCKIFEVAIRRMAQVIQSKLYLLFYYRDKNF